MTRAVAVVSGAALVLFLGASVWMAQLDRTGPPRADVWLSGDVPATLWLPPGVSSEAGFWDPPERRKLPPAVVLMHGFSGDRFAVSGLARRLAESGYAVLAIDAAGHGENRHRYARGEVQPDSFEPEMRAAVDFLREHALVDGRRIAVMGHSMGASAALDHATRDLRVGAAVLVSGGFQLYGPHRPRNVLFLHAEGDPEPLRERSLELAARLAAADELELSVTYGRFERGDAVRAVQIPDADHVSIVRTRRALDEALAWLDASFGLARERGAPPDDPRTPALRLLLLLFALLLPGLGLLAGALVPARATPAGGGRVAGLLGLLAAALVALPLAATGGVGGALPLVVGDVVVAHFALTGLGLLVGMRLLRPQLLAGVLERPLASLAGAGAVLLALHALMQPLAPALHRMTFTPERLLALGAALPGLLLLALPANVLLRRGSVASASLFCAAGRLAVFACLLAAAQLGALPRVTALMLPSLAAASLVLELLAAALYARSRNHLAVAAVDAGWLALVLAAILPVRIGAS
jgi:dienelactone hydrolase